MTTIGINEFARRSHHEDGPGSAFRGSWEELVDMVGAAMARGDFSEDFTADGHPTRLVQVQPDRFVCGVVPVSDEVLLHAVFTRRRPHEDPFIQVVAEPRAKAQAIAVDVVVYSAAALAEGDEASTDSDWEIVTILARDEDRKQPMHPVTMMRNQLGLEGGTQKNYSSEEWADAVHYWSTHCLVGGSV